MRGAGPRFLSRPKIEVVRKADGQVESVFVRVQSPKVPAVRTVHPNPDVLVFFNLDEYDMPVSIVFHEPADGLAIARAGLRRILDPHGQTVGTQKWVKHYFLTEPQLILRFLQTIEEAEKKFEEAPAGA